MKPRYILSLNRSLSVACGEAEAERDGGLRRGQDEIQRRRHRRRQQRGRRLRDSRGRAPFRRGLPRRRYAPLRPPRFLRGRRFAASARAPPADQVLRRQVFPPPSRRFEKLRVGPPPLDPSRWLPARPLYRLGTPRLLLALDLRLIRLDFRGQILVKASRSHFAHLFSS